MPDKSEWAVPIHVIAENRARHYMEEFDNNLDRSLDEDTWPLFESDPDEVGDWASNNMDWKDVRDSATLFSTPASSCNYQEGWVNGKWKLVS